MKLTICKKMCGECPFLKDSAQGYLDYHDPQEILDDMNRDIPFSCHLQRADDPQLNAEELENGNQNVCRGYVATASKSAKLFGQHPFYGKQMRGLQDTITAADKDQVLNKWDWLKYHDI